MKPASTVAAAVFILAWFTREVVSEATTNATKDLQKEETTWQNRPISNRPTGSKGGWSSGGFGNTGYGGNGGYGVGSGGYGGGSGGYGGNSGYGGNGYGGNAYGNSGYGNSGYGNSGYGSGGYGSSGFGNSGYGGYPSGGGGNLGWNNNFGNTKGYTDYNRDTYMTNYGNNDWRRGQGFQSGLGTSNFLQGNLWRGDRNFGQKGNLGNYQPFNDFGSTYGNQIYGSGYSGDSYGYQQKGFGGFGNLGGYPREQGSYPSQQGGGYLIGNRGQSTDENRRRGDFWPPGRRQGNFKGSYGGNPQGRQHRNSGHKGTAFVSRNFAFQNTGW